ncbi:hypothetical protein [Nocardioides yefusunii]|uniref:Uncharacterized protein n=1 Tax=Nocardioides yefusunii TaxID=2500546 RepID=A0ABW1QRQ4_9ACTN|nr:hypothetical protein [Nocardioides yefusunii]
MSDNSPDHRDTSQAAHGDTSGLHDYSGEKTDGLRHAHESVHDGLASADPTGSKGKPLLIAGFIIVMLLVLAAMLLIGVVKN